MEMLSQYFHTAVDQLLHLVDSLGYLGIFILMTIESSFIPFPSEVVMIPAGYLAHQGKMDLSLALISGVAGSLTGALINYYLALWLGRAFILRYGKYFFMPEEKFIGLEKAFLKHGNFATFVCRLIFGIRQWISLPAGLARMPMKPFIFYTSFGAGLWCAILLALGYMLGTGQESNQMAKMLGYWLLAAVAILTLAYIYWWLPRKQNSVGQR